MLESAEIRLTTDFLRKELLDKTIFEWNFTDDKDTLDIDKSLSLIEEQLPLFVLDVNCKGKIIYFVVCNEFKTYYIIHSPGTSSSWQLQDHDNCIWYITHEERIVYFRDDYNASLLKVYDNSNIFNNVLSNLGPDILTDELTLDIWNTLLIKYKNKNITVFLTDQKIISGIGNYIKSEVLYYARISPERKIKELDETEKMKLFEAIRIIPRLSYNAGGMSCDGYTDENGNKGYFDYKLKIYSKDWAYREKTKDNDITYWNPAIQI